MTRRATRVRRHPFNADATVPGDLQGREYCATCGLPGTAGDPRHLTEDEVAQQRREEQRRTGEQP